MLWDFQMRYKLNSRVGAFQNSIHEIFCPSATKVHPDYHFDTWNLKF